MAEAVRRICPNSASKARASDEYDKPKPQLSADISAISCGLPKHIPFPAQIDEPFSNWSIEGFVFLVSIFSLGCQYLEMYKTVWWIPEFSNNQAIHFNLIDKVLLAYIVVILSRKLMAQFVLSSATFLKKRGKHYQTLANLIPHIYAFQLLCLLCVCCFDIFLKYGVWNLLCLNYPIIVYVIIFRFNVEPFVSTFELQAKYFNGIPVHCCSTKAATVRLEVDGLRTDFNNRFKQTIFSSMVIGYYAGFVPYWFLHQHLVHDSLSVILNIIFIWIGGFTLTVVQCFPPKYSDVLHRAALHLGQWKQENVSTSTNVNHIQMWTPNIKCTPGALVKHEGGVYRATGPITTAVPGNTAHYRFYAIFKNPTIIYTSVTIIQFILLSTQFLTLYYTTHWNSVFSLIYLIFANLVPMYCLVRNVRVVNSIYSVEMHGITMDTNAE